MSQLLRDCVEDATSWGKGGSHSKTSQPHHKNRSIPLGLSVLIYSMERRSAGPDFYINMEG